MDWWGGMSKRYRLKSEGESTPPYGTSVLNIWVFLVMIVECSVSLSSVYIVPNEF